MVYVFHRIKEFVIKKYTSNTSKTKNTLKTNDRYTNATYKTKKTFLTDKNYKMTNDISPVVLSTFRSRALSVKFI